MSKFKQFRNLTDSTSVIAEGENLLGFILKGFRLKKHDSFDLILRSLADSFSPKLLQISSSVFNLLKIPPSNKQLTACKHEFFNSSTFRSNA